MTCGAPKRKSGEPCQMVAMANGRCRIHGGKSLSGIAHPQFTTGRYSKYLPARLAGRYQEAVADPELLALRDDISLLDTRIGQVVAALDTGESRESWVALQSAWASFEESFQRLLDTGEVPEDLEARVSGISALIRSGLSEGYVWGEIRALLKERAGLVAAEQRRLVDMQQYVTSEQAMTFVGALMASVRRHVSDQRALAGIAADLARYHVRDGRQPGVAGSAAG